MNYWDGFIEREKAWEKRGAGNLSMILGLEFVFLIGFWIVEIVTLPGRLLQLWLLRRREARELAELVAIQKAAEGPRTPAPR